MSQASTAARARMSEQGNLDPYPVTNEPGTIPFYDVPGQADPAVTLEPRLPLVLPEPEPPAPETE